MLQSVSACFFVALHVSNVREVCTITGIEQAWQAGLVHRDITVGNIMFTRHGKKVHGILNDWDHSGRSGRSNEDDQPFCSVSTGHVWGEDSCIIVAHILPQTTWQFMSIDLLDRSRRTHQLLDDLQSLFWVLVYVALHHCKHGNSYFLVGCKLFDERDESLEADGPAHIGGSTKEKVLRRKQLQDISFVCEPLKRLITDLASAWAEYQHFQSEETTYAREAVLKVSSPSWLRERLQEALDEKGWKDDDFVPDQFPPRTKNDVHRYMDVEAARRNDRRQGSSRPTHTVEEELRLRLKPRARIGSTKGDKKRTISQAQEDLDCQARKKPRKATEKTSK